MKYVCGNNVLKNLYQKMKYKMLNYKRVLRLFSNVMTDTSCTEMFQTLENCVLHKVKHRNVKHNLVRQNYNIYQRYLRSQF